MRGEARRQPRARHGVPLVADAAGVQHERPGLRDGGRQARRRNGDKARHAIPGEEAAAGEQARGWGVAATKRPLKRFQPVECRSARSLGAGNIEGALTLVLEAGETRVLLENLGDRAVGKRLAVAEPPRHLAQHPPVGPRAARQREERALARDAPLRVGDRAVLLAPGGRRKAHMGMGHRVVAGDVLGDDQQVEPGQRRPHGISARQRYRRIGAHHPQRLDATVGNRVEHIDGFETLAAHQIRRIPEPAHAIALGLGETHVRGQHVCKAADLAPAHGVGLARKRERAGTGLADAPGRQMAVDDGVDLVGALRRLVDALAVAGHDARRAGEPAEENSDRLAVNTGRIGDSVEIGRKSAGAPQGPGETARMLLDERNVDQLALGQPHQQPAPQIAIGAGLDGQMQIGALAGGRAPRIDVDHAHAALGPRRLDALIEDGMAPGGIGAGQHDEISQFEVVVALRHHVGAEGAAVARHRRCHAQARVGIDVRSADEAFRELVGDVVVLGQELAGQIEGDGLGSMLRSDGGKTRGHMIQRGRPARARAARQSDAADASRARASHPAPSPWSTGARHWLDARGRP